MDVLKVHSQRSVEEFENKSVVSSYHSAITHDRDANYQRQSRSYRDLMKTQYDKTNQLKALIEMGDLEDNEYEDLGLKGMKLHRLIQDRRQVYHDMALADAHGLKNPFPVGPGGPAQFEREQRYEASTASIATMQPIDLYQNYVYKDQRRLTSRLQHSIRTKVRSDLSTQPKAQFAPLREDSNGHVTGNIIYVPTNTGHQRRTYFNDHIDYREISALEKTAMAAIDRMKNQHSGKEDMGELGQQEAHSSQPDARRITLDPSRINPSVFSSTRRDRASVFSTGLGSAFKNTQEGNASNARHQTPQAGHLQVGRTAMQGIKPPGGPPPGGSASNAEHQIPTGGSPPGGSEASSKKRCFSRRRARNQDPVGQDNMLAGVLQQIAGQMDSIFHNQSYSGMGNKVKEA
jgi:hypothetical protein